MKDRLKRALAWDNLPVSRQETLRRLARGAEDAALYLGSLAGLPLPRLARIAGTKDFGGYGPTVLYDRFFRPLRWRRINLLEIGVGGYDDQSGGKSLRLWRAFFPRAQIAAIDIYDKTGLSAGRVQVYQCSQIDKAGLDRIARIYGGFDIIIDDGSHINEHQIRSFELLFPHLRSGGLYVVEDTQTSYWEGFGGGPVGSPAHARSCVTWFKGLVDGLNHAEFPDAGYRATRYDREIVAATFAHNLIVVEKGDNAKPSNIIGRWDHATLRDTGQIDAAGKIAAGGKRDRAA